MKRIGLISDTHSYLDPAVFTHFKECDEIWHAGDFGNSELITALEDFKPLKGVYGNIDPPSIRKKYPENLLFRCEDVVVFMQHIGGYPGKYVKGIKDILVREKVKLFISGHSHILKVIYDDKINCLHMNPGAAGRQGWQTVRTLIRFTINGNNISNCEVIEL